MTKLADVSYTANGVTTVFITSFDFIEEAHITVTVDDIVTVDYTFNVSNDIEFNTAPLNGEVVRIVRDSDITKRLVAYADGSNLTEEDLNSGADQGIFLQQETRDQIETINADNVATALQVATNVIDIATNLANIDSNDTDIATNVSDISTNTINIATNLANIDSNDTDIATNVSDISDRVVGAVSSTDNALPKYDGVDGKTLQDSGVIISDTNDLTGINTIGVEQITATRTSSADADNPFNIVADGAGYSDINLIDLDYTTGAIPVEAEESVIDINIDDTAAAVGSIVNGIKITSVAGNSDAFGLITDTGVSPIGQLTYTFIPMDSLKVNGVDKLSDVADPMTNTLVFTSQFDTLSIGNMSKFDNIFVDKLQDYTFDMVFTFEYSTGVGTWGTFTPTDGTTGWMTDGNIVWSIDDIPLWNKDVNNEYVIRLTRTRYGGFPSAKLSIDQILIQSKIGYSWNDTGDISIGTMQLGLSPRVNKVLDEDSMVSDDPLALVTQQSVKAYVDTIAAPVSFSDSTFRVTDNSDVTKLVALEVSGVTTGTTRTLTIPNANGTIALTSSISNVDNTSDVDKPVSTATQTALDLKVDDTEITNIDNTSDADKPVSTDTQTALDLKAARHLTVTKTTTATLATTGEENVVVDAASGDFTVTLPTAVGNNGLTYRITKSTAANKVTIEGNGAELIGSELNIELHSIDDDIIIFSDNVGYKFASNGVSVSAKYESNAGQAIGTGATIFKHEDLNHDTHSAYNTTTGIYTVPVDGDYLAIGTTTPNFTPSAVSNYLIIDIYINGTAQCRGVTHTGSTGDSDYGTHVSTVRRLSKGDTISIYTQTQTASNASTISRDNTLSIAKIN